MTKTMNEHLRNTWYKNNLLLRNYNKDWSGFNFYCDSPPKLYGTASFDARVWSVPSLIDENKVVIGCWDNAIHCLDIDSLEPLWNVDTEGEVYGSPWVSDDGSFVFGCVDGSVRRITASGEEIWKYQTRGPCRPNPTIDTERGIVYAGSEDRCMYALSYETGKRIWRKKLSRSGHPRDPGETIYSSSALTKSGNIIFGNLFDTLCLTPEGEIQWSFSSGDDESIFWTTPALDYVSNRGVTSSYNNGAIYLFDIDSGDIIEKFLAPGLTKSSPSLNFDGIAVIGDDDGNVFGLDVNTGKIIWECLIGTALRVTPITTLPSGNVVLPARDQRLHCIDSHTGKILWRLETEKGMHSAPLITPAGRLIVGSHRDTVYFFEW